MTPRRQAAITRSDWPVTGKYPHAVDWLSDCVECVEKGASVKRDRDRSIDLADRVAIVKNTPRKTRERRVGMRNEQRWLRRLQHRVQRKMRMHALDRKGRDARLQDIDSRHPRGHRSNDGNAADVLPGELWLQLHEPIEGRPRRHPFEQEHTIGKVRAGAITKWPAFAGRLETQTDVGSIGELRDAQPVLADVASGRIRNLDAALDRYVKTRLSIDPRNQRGGQENNQQKSHPVPLL